MSTKSTPTGIDPRVLRNALGSFTTGVTVITTLGADGVPRGLTANSFNAVSLEPPLVLFSLACNAECFSGFQDAAHFAVNVLSDRQMEISNRFATKASDKFAGVSWSPGVTGSPLLAKSMTGLECRVVARHLGGDHVIYVGNVLAIHHDSSCTPLVFFGGKYVELAPR